MTDLELVLNDAFNTAINAKKSGKEYNANVMVTGDPASDNQIFINKWARENNVNLYRADILSDGSYYKEVNGIFVKQKDKLDSLLPVLSYSISKQNSENLVVLFNMYNWQQREHYRESILPFVVEHKIYENGELVKKPNVLVCIASVLQMNYGEDFKYTEKEDKAFPTKLDFNYYL